MKILQKIHNVLKENPDFYIITAYGFFCVSMGLALSLAIDQLLKEKNKNDNQEKKKNK
ncbi:hypothetical protein [Candidatus Phytoplasma solani]|uniref:hypothetical protein n=1 Tax=Candidatus Phytoplasma solani TaxID=69896 RepID=UPI0003B7C528|nr:hypothetical protein [Candidatus Phytoplasma solani]CCP88000.1 hypothetical protein, similar to phage tail tape measure protein [Candidatus Phytoplasma solani]